MHFSFGSLKADNINGNKIKIVIRAAAVLTVNGIVVNSH